MSSPSYEQMYSESDSDQRERLDKDALDSYDEEIEQELDDDRDDSIFASNA